MMIFLSSLEWLALFFFCSKQITFVQNNSVDNICNWNIHTFNGSCFVSREYKSGLYKLKLGSQDIPVYCQMGIDECGSGGWTPVMKIDGRKVSVQFDSCSICHGFLSVGYF